MERYELNFIKNQNAFSPINIKEEKEVKTTTIHRDNITMIESGNKLLEISMEFSKLNKEVFSQFRDYLRQFFISLNKLATFDEVYLLRKDILLYLDILIVFLIMFYNLIYRIFL